MYCGTEQDFEELGPEDAFGEPALVSDRRRDDLAPGEKESELLTTLSNGRRRRFSDPLTISLICISSVLLIAFLTLLFGRPIWDRMHASSVASTRMSSQISLDQHQTPPDQPSVAFGVRQVQIAAGERFDLLTVCEPSSETTLLWSSSNPENINVDTNGTVLAIVPGSEATIEATSADGRYLPQNIRVICLSEEAADLIKEVVRLNDQSDILGEIDTEKVSFFSAQKDTSLYWDKGLFYSLEDFPELENDGRINSYRIEKRKMRDADSGNVIEYELFRSPALGIVNKITAIEYLPDSKLEISEYYFENDGTLNFVFVHQDTSYTPSRPAATNIYGNRYYFKNDVMVKWRTVDASGVRDIAIGENEQANTPARYSVTLYTEQDESIQSQYDLLEKRILNRAYTTYFSVLAEEQTSRITGCVTDPDQNPLSNVLVTLIGVTLNDTELFRTFTDETGAYIIHIPPGDRSYALYFEREGAVPVRMSDVDVFRQDVDAYMETIRMVPLSTEPNTVRMLVADAVSRAQMYHEDEFPTEMLRISGAEILFREGIGNLSGNVISTVYSDRNGIAQAELPPGAYTAEILMLDYESTFFSVYSYPDCPIGGFYLSPVLGKGEMRIVLTWAEDPQDLDAHLFTPFVEESTGTESHIWFRDREDSRGNRLDVDATNGYGPETVTVSAIEMGLYKYYVTDFTGCIASSPSSDRMSFSSALVQVYSENGLICSFHVPTGKEGVIWEVFEIRNHSIVPIHRYYSSIADKPWWNTDKKE